MQMLVVYAKDLKEGFADYAPSITKIMVPHLKFFFHELVRAAAAEILPHLLECVKSKGQWTMNPTYQQGEEEGQLLGYSLLQHNLVQLKSTR